MTLAEPDKELLFVDDEPEDRPDGMSPDDVGAALAWKVLIVDDDPEVHLITRTVLDKVRFKDRGLDLLSAHSALEARSVLRSHTDIAAILLDVVMESEDAGLRLVRFIREDLNNRAVRIILRTGQPGQAPEREVIVNYDINDYKAKTELTAQKLFTTIVAALRAYMDIVNLETSREQLQFANAILEQRVADRTAALERSNAELEGFAYGISHDLQEPLRMIRSYLQLIRRRLADKLDAETGEYMAFVEDGATRMGTMIQDLLDYSRISTQPARFAPVHLEAPLKRALANLTLALDEAGATLTLPKANPLLEADESQMARLLQNLLGNAIKYRAPNRPLSVEVAFTPDWSLESDSPGGAPPAWLITVRDNGRGFAPEDSDAVFNLFQRLPGSGGASGSGVGLAVCRRIVEHHGGTIWAEGKPDAGAAFHARLPTSH